MWYLFKIGKTVYCQQNENTVEVHDLFGDFITCRVWHVLSKAHPTKLSALPTLLW